LQTAKSDSLAVHFLDYRETAPLAASQDMYLDKDKNVIPYKSLVGYQASGVPGTVMGLWQAHKRFGSVAWAKLLQPAIELAQRGFEVSPQLEARSKWFKTWIANKSPIPLNFVDYFDGLKVGQTLTQPELAKTLTRIAKQGAHDFYHGQTAKLLVKQLQQHDGLITLEDLASYQAKWREPIVGDWLGYQVISAPPPSSGGIAIVQLLKMKQILAKELHNALKLGKQEGVSEQTIKTHFYAELEKECMPIERIFWVTLIL